MTKKRFYSAAGQVTRIEWWLSECDFPSASWARMRVFANGYADACWEEGGILYGFDEECFASYFFSEDEYTQLSGLDAEDETDFGIKVSELIPPDWGDAIADSGFKYLGTY